MNKRYTIKNPEDIYTSSYEDSPQEYLEAIRNKNICQYALKTIKAGDWIESCIYPCWLKNKDIPKGPRENVSTEAQEKLNDKKAKKKLERLINANFTANKDFVLTANADDKHLFKSTKEARAAASKVVNRLRYRFKKQNKVFKYIYAVEYKKARDRRKKPIVIDGVQMIRVHIHMILNEGLSYSDMRECWQLGQTIHIDPLRDYQEGFVGLAKYLAKDPQDGHRRWAGSKNLKKPKETIAYRKKHTSKSKVKKIAVNEYLRKDYFEKIYKDYDFIDCEEPLFNEINDGVYIYARLRRKKEKKRTR